MKKHFYSHLVETSILSLELGDIEMAQEERVHLISLAESQLHHVIIDAILSKLSEEDKKIFLDHLVSGDDEKIWQHLKKKIQNVEKIIKTEAEELKKQLHKDIKHAKK